MEADLTRSPARPADEADGVPIGEPSPADLHLAPGKTLPTLSRCPYCREDVRASGAPWVACEECLARHHTSCWDEHGACASCRGRVPLERRRRRAAMIPLVVFALLGIAGLVALVGVRFYVEKAKIEGSSSQLVDLPVAARDLHVGDVVSEKDIQTRKFPRAILEALGRYLDDSKVIEGSKVLADIKQGQVFTQPQFRRAQSPSPAMSLDRDIEVAKIRGRIRTAASKLRSYEPEATFHKSDLLSSFGDDLVEDVRKLDKLGLVDEAARTKRAAEALFANELLADVAKLLEGAVAKPSDGLPIAPRTAGVGDQPGSPPKESK